MSTGRKRCSAAIFAPSSTERPSDHWVCAYVTMRMASWMATPKMETKPIAADTEKFMPVKSRARRPPAHATGIFRSTTAVKSQSFTAL